MKPDTQMISFNKRVACAAEAVKSLQDEIELLLTSSGVRLRDIRSICMALEEILNLIFDRAFGGSQDAAVDVRIDLLPAEVCALLSFSGPPVNPLQVPDKTEAVSFDRSEADAMRLHLAGKLVDQLEYHHQSDSNVILLRKTLPMCL
jgi:anti-sigma regulatory factor (Ser/Thr protein kinase)